MGKFKKIKTKIIFNSQERELCVYCRFPKGFCSHTIEKQYQELCPISSLEKEHIWQLTRSYAIKATEHKNSSIGWLKENRDLIIENSFLKKENNSLIEFKKHIEDILLKRSK